MSHYTNLLYFRPYRNRIFLKLLHTNAGKQICGLKITRFVCTGPDDLNLNEIFFDCFTFFVIHRVSFRIGIIGGGQAGTMRNSQERAKSSYCSYYATQIKLFLEKNAHF